jgi:hypothetical protein
VHGRAKTNECGLSGVIVGLTSRQWFPEDNWMDAAIKHDCGVWLLNNLN